MNRITSVGEILYDVYPGRKTLGGAPFNFIYHIIKLVGVGNFVTRIGNDKAGKDILVFLNDNRIVIDFVQIDRDHQTGESIAVLDDNKIPSWRIKTNTAYDFIEPNEKIEFLISEKTDCLYFGTLAQRNTKSRNCIRHFFNRNIKYFCDLNIRQKFYTKEIVRECLKTCDVLKLNLEELRLVNDLLLNNVFDSNETPKRLLNEYEISLLCITYGDQGATLFQGSQKNHYKIKVENVVDTVGAGDAYAAILCMGYLNDWAIEKTNMIATEFAGEIVKIRGALPPGESIYKKYKKMVNEQPA